jgi:broad specificity phosphatase PhoE
MTRFYLLRHAQAQKPHCYHGRRSDPDLSEIGQAQADALGQRLAEVGFRVIYSSPLGRARQTAAAVVKHQQCAVETMEDLAEIDFGLWDGLTYKEITSRDAGGYSRWIVDPSGFTTPEGESLGTFFQRVRAAFEQIRTHHTEGDVAVVSHGGPIRSILCSYLGLGKSGFWSLEVDLASFSILGHNEVGRCVLSRLNDTCHLQVTPSGESVDGTGGHSGES